SPFKGFTTVVVVQLLSGSTARFVVSAVLYSERRYQLKFTATPGRSSCCTPALYWRLYSREKFGSSVRLVIFPKFGLLLGPISLSCAMPSPLRSFQVRVSVNVATGLNRLANVLESGVMYLPKLA